MQISFPYDISDAAQILNNLASITLDDCLAQVDQLPYILDIEKCPDDKLHVISNLIGYPVDNQDDPNLRRNILKYAIDFYKVKGTPDSVRILFYTLGFDIDVVPLWTPDYQETKEVFPPYLKITLPITTNPYPSGYYSITVQNPDNQTDTETSAFQYTGYDPY
jgi:P2-related tail formation protein